MFVEDYLHKIYRKHLYLSKNEEKFLESVLNSDNLSTKQAAWACNMIEKYAYGLSQCLNIPVNDIVLFSKSPVYLKTPYQSFETKNEIRWLGNNKLLIKIKYITDDDNLILKPTFIEKGLYSCQVTNSNKSYLMNFIKQNKFEFDDNVLQYFFELQETERKVQCEIEDDILIVNIYNDGLCDKFLEMMYNV